MSAASSSKVIYALLQKAAAGNQQVCVVEVPSASKKAEADDMSLNYKGSPSPTYFGAYEGSKIISGNSSHFRKRKMVQEPRVLDSDEGSEARIAMSARTVDSKIRSESENLVLQKAPVETMSSVIFDDFSDSGSSSYYGKKRARLNHLTTDEKMTRRKVMNRIAAQQARDRKKLKMEKMETSLQRLEVENRYLRCENTELKEKLDKLSTRFNHLLVQLESGSQGASALSSAQSANRTAGPVAPRQQGSGLLRLLMTLALALQLSAPSSGSATTLVDKADNRGSREKKLERLIASYGRLKGALARRARLRRKCLAWMNACPSPTRPCSSLSLRATVAPRRLSS